MSRTDLYGSRRLAEGYPELESISTEVFSESLSHDTGQEGRVARVLELLDRLIDLSTIRRIAVVGCGPRPETVRILAGRGFDVIGIEPVEGHVEHAQEFLDGAATVAVGTAERLPLADGSQHVVFLESVLEHVDSPIHSLEETYRVLAPGGIAFVTTTNRLRLAVNRKGAEFNVRFYNWLPALVKECYVHRHLHYDPRLANYTPRPAVHWFTFNSLCALGRTAGFAQFYSHIDLLRADDPSVRSSLIKRRLVDAVRLNPWARAAALTQVGGLVVMRKRPVETDDGPGREEQP